MPARSRPLPDASLYYQRTLGTAWTLLKSMAKPLLKPLLLRTRTDTISNAPSLRAQLTRVNLDAARTKCVTTFDSQHHE